MQASLSVRTAAPPSQTARQTRPARQRLAPVQASSDPLLQKPVARPQAPAAPSDAAAPAAAAPPAAAATISGASSGVTIEYQRQQAKAMQKYFQSLKLAETVDKAKVFGWTKKNEIGNGRWVMMGIAIGLMTEYATGVSFIDQLKLMASYLGLVDVDY
ncbi:hypothetical protein D9Q98_000440 [Chlorella vulgaris]|uniref:Uncharacterized protein n=1 Tax=Chlorella vulgaris TaxID=3077 RepID=A0A9D4TYB9_CHLVU|nr:hypothetical protein D9Q98_000440 [Chlorella vulgaris]